MLLTTKDSVPRVRLLSLLFGPNFFLFLSIDFHVKHIFYIINVKKNDSNPDDDSDGDGDDDQ